MRMYNPPHPGSVIKEAMEELGLKASSLARALDVAPSTVNRLINEKADISPEMAIRLSVVIGSSEELWLKMQDNYNLWHARQKVDTTKLHRLQLKHA